MGSSAVEQAVRSLTSHEVIMGERSDTLRKLARRMHDASCGAIIVESGDGHGIVTERDIVKSLATGGDPDREWAVDLMTRDVQHVDATATVADVAELMQVGGFRHVLVDLDDGAVGVVSIRDLLEPFLEAVSQTD